MEMISLKQKRKNRYIHEEMRASSIFSLLAYDDENEIFINDDQTAGFAFLCEPVKGADEQMEERLKSFINTDFPNETIMQVLWFRSPDIMKTMADMELMRIEKGINDPLMKDFVSQRADFFRKSTLTPIDGHTLLRVHDLKICISVKIPIKSVTPSKEEVYMIDSYRKKARASLQTLRMMPMAMNAKHLLRLLSTLLNWSPESSWRQNAIEHDQHRPLSEQILDYENDITYGHGHVKVGDTYIKSLSAKRLPDSMFFGDAIKYVGDLRGGNVAIKQNYAIVCNIYYPSPDKAKSSMERSRAIALNQAKGPLVSLVPILAEKKKGFDTLYDSLNDGNRIIKMTYTMLLFGKSEDEVTEAGVQARSYWREQRFTLLEDRFVQLPLLINCLPMMADRDAVSDLWRYKTITAEHAAVILPVFGEWKGTGTPHMNLVSRNGQLMTFSMHDTSSNKNMLICATSGGGKSFFTNDIIMSYMSEGAQVWVIDVGRSYLKLAEALNGDFIHFGSDSDISINPFPMIVSMDGQKGTRSRMLSEEEIWSIESGEESDDGEEDAIVGLVCAMATINSPLDDVQLTALRAIISKIWLEKDREMLVDHVADECAKSEDRRVRDLATRLQAFTSKGSYGRYFSRPNNVTFNNQLTVLELEELKSRAHLQKVVLFQLIYQIQQAVYLGDRSKRKLVIIDEAWDLLANGGPEVQRFIEHAYRRFRKYGASVLLVTQSIQDMYKSPVGEAIVENSATKGLFSHKDEAVDKLKREAKLTLSEGGYSLLKTVHTNAPWYSEIFLETERGGGVGRLFVNDFQKLLYSTNPEEVAEIESYTKRGYSTVDAINAILKSRSRARS